MQDLNLYLSGNVPGGFLLLTFIIVSINLALYFLYKSSKLFDKKVYRRKSLRFNISLMTLYVFLWIYLQPPGLPVRVAYLPWQDGDSIDVNICEALQLSSESSISDDYFLHRWEWFYGTADPDSIVNPEYRARLAESLQIELFVIGKILRGGGTRVFDISIYDQGDLINSQFRADNFRKGIQEIGSFLADKTDFLASLQLTDYTEEQINLISGTKLEFLHGKFENALSVPVDEGREIDILKARALIQMGRQEQSPKKRASLQNIEINKNFQKARALLIPYSKSEKDNAGLNVSLSRMYMHMGDYETAEICLKRAFAQDPFDSRVYFMISFLHKSRFEDVGFADRKTILEKAIRLDPGYADAVFELANEYYVTGTGTASGYSTNYAQNLLLEYMKINSNKYQVLNLLGKIYLQTNFTLEAKTVFGKLIELYPASAEINYNLGVSYYQLKEFDRAEALFKKAVAINDDLDSYLYLGAIYKLRGELDLALEYFRDRIRKKTGDDDHYAKEAMRQVRIILNMQDEDSLQVGENEDKNSVAL